MLDRSWWMCIDGEKLKSLFICGSVFKFLKKLTDD
jgi:hypothetical protein